MFGASNSREIDVAFANLARKRPDALLVSSQGLFSNRRVQIVTHATRQGLPGMYFVRDFVEAGGLMSYGSSTSEQFRLTGVNLRVSRGPHSDARLRADARDGDGGVRQEVAAGVKGVDMLAAA